MRKVWMKSRREDSWGKDEGDRKEGEEEMSDGGSKEVKDKHDTGSESESNVVGSCWLGR